MGSSLLASALVIDKEDAAQPLGSSDAANPASDSTLNPSAPA